MATKSALISSAALIIFSAASPTSTLDSTTVPLLLTPDLLILDDFAVKGLTKFQAEDFYELIDQRYRSGFMIATANRSPEDWYPLFPNPVIAESALDHLASCSHVITLTGKSYRALLRSDEALEKEVVTV